MPYAHVTSCHVTVHIQVSQANDAQCLGLEAQALPGYTVYISSQAERYAAKEGINNQYRKTFPQRGSRVNGSRVRQDAKAYCRFRPAEFC